MIRNHPKEYTRRAFIGTSLIGLAGASLFPLKSCAKPNDRINLGFIGLGLHVNNNLINSFLAMEGVRVVAGADVYAIKRERFMATAQDFYREAGIDQKVTAYEDYQKMLNRKDIDAVVIASPDHWHAIMAIDACKAGKDIYLEKPLTLTIKEGQEVVKAVRSYKRILAVGSMQRSDPDFMYAINAVREGKIGKLEKVYASLLRDDPHPKPYILPEESVPDGLNWINWLGPLPYYHFNYRLNPPISLDPPEKEAFWAEWRYYKEFSGGWLTDWGAHMIDIAQWGMGCDDSGPVKIIPAGHEGYDYLTYIYDNGLNLTIKNFMGDRAGVKFWGTEGWIEVGRGYFNASDESLVSGKEIIPYGTGRTLHHKNFIESVKLRIDPVVPVEIGHRSCTACSLGNIAFELNRAIQWNPEKESFIQDAEAHKHLHREYRNGYNL